MPATLSITCLCGALAQTVTAVTDNQSPIPTTLCHCNTCRRTSGVLCTSYCPIEAPCEIGRLLNEDALLTAYAPSSSGTVRYFCHTCGCHVFRSRRQQQMQDLAWEVATGVIVEEKHDASSNGPSRPVMEYTRHDHVQDTGDGGLAVWIQTVGGRAMVGRPDPAVSLSSARPPAELGTPASRTVPASCHCGAVQFTVRPADFDPEASRRPHSGFPDLFVPFAATAPAITANPDNVKWWLRPSPKRRDGSDDKLPNTRWLAGTCACRSCRLATGFEIQTWAFVPRMCIILPDGQPLSFDQEGKSDTLTALTTYRSSPGVERNFCSRCGATVFWHDKSRPDIIDVSVGLLQPGSGAGCRVEALLDWCTSRVSFVEEAPRERRGQSALRGSHLADGLEDGMKQYTEL